MRHGKFVVLGGSLPTFLFHFVNERLGILAKTNFFICLLQILQYILDIPKRNISSIQPVGVLSDNHRTILIDHRIGQFTVAVNMCCINNLIGLDVARLSVVNNANVHGEETVCPWFSHYCF